jgi:3-phenylpropionate/trans-cinnamate dioxygenase ferredoxin reductase subunit
MPPNVGNSIDRIVILGAGQAGGWAAKTLRAEGFAGTITLVGDEVHPPYERPPLSKAFLTGDADPASAHLFKPAMFAALALDWRWGVRAKAIHRAERYVELESGEQLAYDRLILCTGGRARGLVCPGAEQANLHTLRSIEDAQALRRALLSSRDVVIVSGGWIGLEVAAAARHAGAQVRVVEAAPRLCARVLPGRISALVQKMHERHGVGFALGRSVSRFERERAGRTRVVLDDGQSIDADSVVAGIGLIPNDELARAAGLACSGGVSGGVIVDRRCVTSDPHILAAGDIAVAPNACAGGPVRLESWQNAQDQGVAAARAALGLDVRYDPLPKFWSDQYDANIQILGWPSGGADAVVRGDPATGRFLVFALEGARIRAVIAFNSGRDMRPARRLIDMEVDVKRLADPSVELANVQPAPATDSD